MTKKKDEYHNDFSKVGSSDSKVDLKPRPLPFGATGLPSADDKNIGVEELDQIENIIEHGPSDQAIGNEIDAEIKKYKRYFILGGLLFSIVAIVFYLNHRGKVEIEQARNRCENGKSDACVFVGYMMTEEGREEDAELFYQKACNLDDGIGCYNIAAISKDQKKHDKYMKMACDRNEIFGCQVLGQSLFDQKQFEKSKYSLNRACALGENMVMSERPTPLEVSKRNVGKISCAYYGLVTNNRELVEQSIQYYKMKCGFNDSVACYDAACIYSLSKDSESSIKFLKRALSKGFKDREWMEKDPDLVFIRTTPAYKEL